MDEIPFKFTIRSATLPVVTITENATDPRFTMCCAVDGVSDGAGNASVSSSSFEFTLKLATEGIIGVLED